MNSRLISVCQPLSNISICRQMSRSCSVAVGGSGVDAWTEFSVVIAANICSTAFPTSTSSCTCNTTGQLCFNQTGRQGLYVFCLSVRPLVLLPDLCEINSFLCKLGRGPRGKGKKLNVRGLGGQGHATFLIALVWVAFLLLLLHIVGFSRGGEPTAPHTFDKSVTTGIIPKNVVRR